MAEGSDKTRRSFRPLAVAPAAGPAHHLTNRQASTGHPHRQPGHLSVQTDTLIMRGHPRVDHHAAGRAARVGTSTAIVPVAVCSAGTGSLPSGHHRYAV